ncbi:hypothetical protein [Moritella sp. F3]|uniref:hypothetical protein n=1 Tax=Moritella sp. F3 TaxID=2718882 RepID=UPI0018E0FECA|nr:hypothetical protein [Moritella sp. F3]GIC77730.1 hypothetical protein FMO001_24570 [Moritella sp. F1]GIC82143.1 hypothetical protein FMO003_24240 [Moritella sp. F3]
MEKILMIELIKAATGIVQALIPTIGAIFIGKRLIKNQVLIESLKTALTDLNFMLIVEQIYCEQNRESKLTGKNLIRQKAKEEAGYAPSGKFSKSKIVTKIQSLNKH